MKLLLSFRPLLGVMLACCLWSSCRPEWYTALRSQVPPQIDGTREDWSLDQLQSHADAPLRYALRQDQARLYLLLLVDDLTWQQHLLMTGLTCYLAPYGKARQERGIRYPMGLDPSNRPRDPKQLNRFLGRLYANREALLGTMQDLVLVGFEAKGSEALTDNPGPQGLTAAARFQGDTLVWELAVPLTLLPGLRQADQLTLRWETGKLVRPEQLRGEDAAGLSGSNPANPTQARGQTERDWLARLDRYRNFAAPREAKVRVRLPGL